MAGRVERLAERDGWICWLCEGVLDPTQPTETPGAVTIDHVVPKSRGGSNDLDNLRLAHRRCNGRRGSQATELEWPQDLPLVDASNVWVAISGLVRRRKNVTGPATELVALCPDAGVADRAARWIVNAAESFVGGDWTSTVEPMGVTKALWAVRLVAPTSGEVRDPGRARANNDARRGRSN